MPTSFAPLSPTLHRETRDDDSAPPTATYTDAFSTTGEASNTYISTFHNSDDRTSTKGLHEPSGADQGRLRGARTPAWAGGVAIVPTPAWGASFGGTTPVIGAGTPQASVTTGHWAGGFGGDSVPLPLPTGGHGGRYVGFGAASPVSQVPRATMPTYGHGYGVASRLSGGAHVASPAYGGTSVRSNLLNAATPAGYGATSPPRLSYDASSGTSNHASYSMPVFGRGYGAAMPLTQPNGLHPGSIDNSLSDIADELFGSTAGDEFDKGFDRDMLPPHETNDQRLKVHKTAGWKKDKNGRGERR